MANFRQVHVSMWKDSWFLELSAPEKLLFVYLFSNESANMAGFYKLPRKVIAFETGLDLEFIDHTLDKFARADKVHCEGDLIWVVNMRKYHATKSQKVIRRIELDLRNISDCDLKRKYIAYHTPKIPYPYPIDTLPLREVEEEEEEEEKEDEKEEVEVEAFTTSSPASVLSAAFVTETGIPELTGGPQKWIEAAADMVKAGVEPADIITAVNEIRDKGYQIVSLRSIVNPAINAMSKRKRGTNGGIASPSGKSGRRTGSIERLLREVTANGE